MKKTAVLYHRDLKFVLVVRLEEQLIVLVASPLEGQHVHLSEHETFWVQLCVRVVRALRVDVGVDAHILLLTGRHCHDDRVVVLPHPGHVEIPLTA